MGIVSWIVIGLIAGWLASMIMGTSEGLIVTILLGMAGAVVGGYLAGALLHIEDPTGLNVETIVVSVIGAVIVLGVVRWARGAGGGSRRRLL